MSINLKFLEHLGTLEPLLVFLFSLLAHNGGENGQRCRKAAMVPTPCAAAFSDPLIEHSSYVHQCSPTLKVKGREAISAPRTGQVL